MNGKTLGGRSWRGVIADDDHITKAYCFIVTCFFIVSFSGCRQDRMAIITDVGIMSSKDGTAQRVKIICPDSLPQNKRPLIVVTHSWSCDIDNSLHYQYIAKLSTAWDFVAVCPDYRGRNDNPSACGSDFAVQDIMDAINFAIKNYEIDSSRICIIGGSGGGHIALLMLGRHPDVFAGVAVYCPITDLSRWHRESLEKGAHVGRDYRYARMLEAVCGGTPKEVSCEYQNRSPIYWLTNRQCRAVATLLATGIHDGWEGSVPVGHAIRAFNALSDENDRISETEIDWIESHQALPLSLEQNTWKGLWIRVSNNVQLEIFEGAHDINWDKAVRFVLNQRKGQSVRVKDVSNGVELKMGIDK